MTTLTIPKYLTRISFVGLCVVFILFSSTVSVKADERCGPGKVFSRDTINCIQEFCPPSTGRNYSNVCQCYNADWGGQPRVDCRNSAGLLTHCVAEGQSCTGTVSTFDPVTGVGGETEVQGIVPVPTESTSIDPEKFVAIHRNTEPCDITIDGAITVRTIRAPEGVQIDDSVVAVDDGKTNIAGQDAEASVGDRIDVPSGYSVEVRIPGAIVHLSENSHFTLPCKQAGSSVNLSGQGYFNVLDLIRPDLFTVVTSNGIAGVKGTRFFVDARADDKTIVLLEEGVVELKSRITGEAKEIHAGEKGEILNSGITTGLLNQSDNQILAQYADVRNDALSILKKNLIYIISGGLFLIFIIGLISFLRKRKINQ